MIMATVFNKQQLISMVSRQLHLSEYKSQAELNNHSLACGRWTVLTAV